MSYWLSIPHFLQKYLVMAERTILPPSFLFRHHKYLIKYLQYYTHFSYKVQAHARCTALALTHGGLWSCSRSFASGSFAHGAFHRNAQHCSEIPVRSTLPSAFIRPRAAADSAPLWNPPVKCFIHSMLSCSLRSLRSGAHTELSCAMQASLGNSGAYPASACLPPPKGGGRLRAGGRSLTRSRRRNISFIKHLFRRNACTAFHAHPRRSR